MKKHSVNNLKTSGFTILESLVATLILLMGMGYIWYTFTTSSKIELKYRQTNSAHRLAQSELEWLRLLPPKGISDSSWEIKAPGNKTFRVVRNVFDSLDMEDYLYENNIPEPTWPTYFARPSEIKIDVFLIQDKDEQFEEDTARSLVSLTTLLPEVKWY